MRNGKILILNPGKLSEGEKLIRICKSYGKLRIEIETNAPTQIICPDLIFLLTNGFLKYDLIKFRDLLDRFRAQPVIAVVNCDSFEGISGLEQHRIWAWLSTPLREIDVRLLLNQLLPSAKNSALTSTKEVAGLDLLKGRSQSIHKVKAQVRVFAKYDATVLIKGATGTGKELCAKMVHFLSRRANKPFVPVNCGSIPKELFENELFGHRKGAYTNAGETQTGLVHAAEGGTLFLDEIESMPLSVQAKLLRFLEDRQFKPLGQSRYQNADVRIIVAAKDNLKDLVKRRRFRDDLYYRLDVVSIDLMPLTDRIEDIPILVNHFLDRYAELYDKARPEITPRALLRLMNYDWPGNVRQLENLIHGLTINSEKPYIDFTDISLEVPEKSNLEIEPLQCAKRKVLEEFERRYLQNLLLVGKGNISLSSKLAGKERSSFCRLLKKYDIDVSAYRNVDTQKAAH